MSTIVRKFKLMMSGNDWWNRNVFSCRRKEETDGADCTSSGRVLQKTEAATGNERRPAVDRRWYCGTSEYSLWCSSKASNVRSMKWQWQFLWKKIFADKTVKIFGQKQNNILQPDLSRTLITRTLMHASRMFEMFCFNFVSVQHIRRQRMFLRVCLSRNSTRTWPTAHLLLCFCFVFMFMFWFSYMIG